MSRNSPANMNMNTPPAAASVTASSNTPNSTATSASQPQTPQHITLPEPFVMKLRKQIEFYFSPQNLQKDIYLRNIMMQYGGSFVPLIIICQFPKVVRLCESFNLAVDPFMILRVMEGSSVVFVTMDALWIGIRQSAANMSGGTGGVSAVSARPSQPQAQPQPLSMPNGPVRSTSLGVMPNSPMNHVAGTSVTTTSNVAPTTTTTTTTTGKDTPTSTSHSLHSNESSPSSSSSLQHNNNASDTTTTTTNAAAAVPAHPSSSQAPPPAPVSPSRNVPRPNLQMRSHTTGQFTRMHPGAGYMYPTPTQVHGHGGHGHPMMRPMNGMVPPPPNQAFYGNVMMPPPQMRNNVRYMQGYTYVGSTVSSTMSGYKYFHPNPNVSGMGRPPVVMSGGGNGNGGNNGGNNGGGNGSGSHHSSTNNNNSGGNPNGMPKSSSHSNLANKNNGPNGSRKNMEKKKKKKEGSRNGDKTKKKKKDVNLDVNHFPALGGGKNKEEEKKVVVPVVSGYAAALLAKKEKVALAQDVVGNSENVTSTEETAVQELEKQVGAMNMENNAIAIGALTGSPVKISQDGVDGTEMTVPQSKKIESIEIDGPTPKEAALPPKSEALDGKVDSVAVQQDATTPSTEKGAPVSSVSNSPSPPAAWGGKRSFIDVVKKQP